MRSSSNKKKGGEKKGEAHIPVTVTEPGAIIDMRHTVSSSTTEESEGGGGGARGTSSLDAITITIPFARQLSPTGAQPLATSTFSPTTGDDVNQHDNNDDISHHVDSVSHIVRSSVDTLPGNTDTATPTRARSPVRSSPTKGKDSITSGSGGRGGGGRVSPSISITDYKKHVAASRKGEVSPQQQRESRNVSPTRRRVTTTSSTPTKTSPMRYGGPISSSTGSRSPMRRQQQQRDNALRPLSGSTVQEAIRRVAGATPDTPSDFSADVYRELHQRQFATQHEELTFLRIDFVHSRKTLAVLYDNNKRLQEELHDKVSRISILENEIDVWRRKGVGPNSGGSGVGGGASSTTSPSRRGSCKTPGLEDDAVDDGSGGLVSGARPASSALWLYAATAPNKRPKRHSDRSDIAAEDLINELRRNLAKRDTALEQCTMENGALKKAHDVHERELKRLQQDMNTTAQERQAAFAKLDEKILALQGVEDALKQSEIAKEKMENEVAALTKKCELFELLKGGLLNGNAIHSNSSGGAVVPEGSDVNYLLEQVRTYRAKWQSADEKVENLLRELEQVKRRPVSQLPSEAVSNDAVAMSDMQQRRYEAELQDHMETIQRLQRRLQREQESGSFREEQQRQQKHEEQRMHQAELSALREQLQAVKAQLAQETSDRESLVRQLRQATHCDAMSDALQSQNQSLKQRFGEVSAELAQVRGRERELEVSVQREIAERIRLERENESLHLQRKQHDSTERMLLDEVNVLRQKIGVEMGRQFTMEQHIALNTGGGSAPTTSETAAAAGADIVRARGNAALLPGDAQSISSELKGYAALMALNTTLQEQMGVLEAELSKATAALRHSCCHCANNNDSNEAEGGGGGGGGGSTPTSGRSVSLVLEVERLQEELRLTRQGQQQLLDQCHALRLESQSVMDDNLILANGAEAIHEELQALRASTNQIRHRGSEAPPQPPRGSRVRERLISARSFQPAESDDVVAEAQQQQQPVKEKDTSTSSQCRLAEDLQVAKQRVRILKEKLRHCAAPQAAVQSSPCEPRNKKKVLSASLPSLKPATAISASADDVLFDAITREALKEEADRVDAVIASLQAQLSKVTKERDVWQAKASAAAGATTVAQHPGVSVCVNSTEMVH